MQGRFWRCLNEAGTIANYGVLRSTGTLIPILINNKADCLACNDLLSDLPLVWANMFPNFDNVSAHGLNRAWAEIPKAETHRAWNAHASSCMSAVLCCASYLLFIIFLPHGELSCSHVSM